MCNVLVIRTNNCRISRVKFQIVGVLQKSTEVISKIPTIMLSISYKGVKFIDAKSKVSVYIYLLFDSHNIVSVCVYLKICLLGQ